VLDVVRGDLHNVSVAFNTGAKTAFPVSKKSEKATKQRNMQSDTAEERKELNKMEEASWQ
jgi:hypothetical protein